MHAADLNVLYHIYRDFDAYGRDKQAIPVSPLCIINGNNVGQHHLGIGTKSRQ